MASQSTREKGSVRCCELQRECNHAGSQVRFALQPGRVSEASIAWLDKQTGDVVKMDASLLNDMSDIGLRSLSIHVEYKPISMGKSPAVNLPTKAVVELETPRQHWRNTHIFDAYKRFSAVAEQDPKVKILAPVPDSDKDKDQNAAEAAPDAKEKP